MSLTDHPPLWDRADGLRRVGGDPRRFASIVGQFVNGHADAALRVRRALEAGERETAQRIAHSLKGVAGNIGASRVQRAAAALEAALRSDATAAVVEEMRMTVAAEVAALVPDLIAYAAQSAPVAAPAVGDPVRLIDVIEELALLLNDTDPGAVDLVETHGAVLATLFGEAEFRRFAALVHDYAFDDAAAMLRAAVAVTSG